MWITLVASSVLVSLFLVLATRPDTRGRRLLVLGISGLVAAAIVVVLNWPARSEAEVRCTDPRGCARQPSAGSDEEDPSPDPVEEGPDEVQVEDPPGLGGCLDPKRCGDPVLNSDLVDGGVTAPIGGCMDPFNCGDPVTNGECSDPKHCGGPRLNGDFVPRDGGVNNPIGGCVDPKHCGDPRASLNN
jgi:hypothetical protein